MKTSTLVLTIVLLTALIAGSIFYFRDTEGPQLAMTPAAGPVSGNRPPTLELSDPPSGLREVTVTLTQNGKTQAILARAYPMNTHTRREPLALDKLGIKDGPIVIRVVTTDRSIFPFGAGNTTDQTFTFDYDSKSPVISVLSRSHNLNRGGAGLVLYTISEEVDKTGVMVGDRFFPAYQQSSGSYACMFAFPFDVPAAQFVPKVVAMDRAGNERHTGFYYHANDKNFRRRQINVSQNFLDAKMPPFESEFPEAGSSLEVFLKVNRELRQRNRAALVDFGRQTAPSPLWEGVFLRQPNTATLALFADHRSYMHKKQVIDQQTHLGIDLASVSQAPLVAANNGTVVFADEMGIYGLCVIIDHGLGLQTLYGHLSRISVEAGQSVVKGEIVGNSGATGMAGGDHLHFGVILSGLPIAPIEWWDASWIKNNITSKIDLAKTGQ